MRLFSFLSARRGALIVALSVNSNVQEPATMISDPAQVMDKCETSVFSQVVHEAEKIGKPVTLVAIAAGIVTT